MLADPPQVASARPTAVMMGRAKPASGSGVRRTIEARHLCLSCRRKFPTAAALARHEQQSDAHKRNLDKREDKMKKRKKELIMAARSIRQQIYEADEALQSQSVSQDAVQTQRAVLELQLQQLLGEYGQAQEIIESCRLLKEEKDSGGQMAKRQHNVRVGKLQLNAGVACWQSNKEVQEDRYMIDIEVESPEGHKIGGFAVLDGHSGCQCVEHVVETLQKHLQKCIGSKPKLSDENITKAVHEACVLTDDDFLKRARKEDLLDGSTMILALVYPQEGGSGNCKLLVACIGDSRAVLCKVCDVETQAGVQQQLMAVPLSEDHKPNRPDEQRRIESKGGVVDFEGVWRVFMPGPAKFAGQMYGRWGLAVSRSFGDLLLKEAEKFECAGVLPGGLVTSVPEIRIMPLDADDDRFIVLASDGVWDVISNEDAVGICSAQTSPELAAQRLLRHVYASNSDDNVTALVLTWKSAE